MDEKSFDELWNADDLNGTEENLRMLTLKAKGTGNPYVLTQLLARIARAQGMQDKFEAAMATLGEADFVLLNAAQRDPAEHPAKHRAWIRYMIERGRLFACTGWHQSAENFLHDACHMARDLGQFDLLKESLDVIKSLQLAVPAHSSAEPQSSP